MGIKKNKKKHPFNKKVSLLFFGVLIMFLVVPDSAVAINDINVLSVDNVVVFKSNIVSIDNTLVFKAVLSTPQFSYLLGVMLSAIFAISWKAHL